jgi:NAD(P)H-dependent FMN reductase
MKNITVLSGSVREGRKSHFMAEIIFKTLNQKADLKTTLLDLKDYNFPVMQEVDTDKWPVGFQAFSDQLSKSDGIVIVSPEYKNSIPGALKNALDYLQPQIFRHIPVGIATVSSGGFGGIQCLSQLRLVVLCVSKVGELFDGNGLVKTNSIQNETVQFLESFLWYVNKFQA